MRSFQILICAALFCCAACSAEKPPTPPNIVFVLADDLGWRDVGFNGSQFYETPNLDRLAKTGIQFTNAYANAGNCAPTRASIMSGQYTFRHGVLTVKGADRGDKKAQRLIPIPSIDTLRPSIVSLAEKLKTAGYHTAHFGKWHLGNDPVSGPTAHGFDLNVGGWRRGSPKSYFSPYQNPALEDGPVGEQLTDRLTNEVIAYLDERKENDQPFFINFWTYGVHTPIQTKPELKAKYAAKAVTDQQDNPTYAGMIQSLDENMGRLIKTLEQNGQMDNTIFVFFSDNGGSWNATENLPLKGAKGTLYEGGIRVPAIVYAPALYGKARVIDQPIISTDFYPTFMDWAGISKTETDLLDGRSLVPLLAGDGSVPETIFWYYPVYLPGNKHGEEIYAFRNTPSCALRRGDYKLIRFYGEEHDELYNLRTDVGELNDLRTTEPQKYQALQTLMDDWHAENNIPMPSEFNSRFDSAHVQKNYSSVRVR